MVQANPYPLRIDEDLMQKIKEISESEGRSVNKQIEFILKEYVVQYLDSHKNL